MDDHLGKRIQRLENIEAIKTLKHKSWRYYDTQDLDLLMALFTEDVTIATAPPASTQVHGRQLLREHTEKAFSASLASHQGHGPVIELTSDTTATGYWSIDEWFYFFDRGEEWHAKGFYLDEYVKINGAWLIHRLMTKFTFREMVTRAR